MLSPYVLIQTEVGKAAHVAQALSDLDGVPLAEDLAGPYDVCDGLGFDKYADLTTEYQVKGEFADYGLRTDRELVAFIEVKRVATKLSTRHLRQVEMYAVNEGVEWIILTNGATWQVYHITGGLPVVIDLALEVDLLGDEPPAHKVNQLFYLSRESLKKRQIDELWKARRATSPASLAQVLVSDPVAEAIRKERGARPAIGSTPPRSSAWSATRCLAPAACKGQPETKRMPEATLCRVKAQSSSFAPQAKRCEPPLTSRFVIPCCPLLSPRVR